MTEFSITSRLNGAERLKKATPKTDGMMETSIENATIKGGNMRRDTLKETAAMEDTLKNRIQERLDALGYSANEAATKAGVNRTLIHSILQGRSKHPRTDTIAKLANVLGCSVSYLTGSDIKSINMSGGPSTKKPIVLRISGTIDSNRWSPKGQEMKTDGAYVAAFADERFGEGAEYFALTVDEQIVGIQQVSKGDTLICVAWNSIGIKVQDGMLVVLKRTVADGMVENYSVRRAITKGEAVSYMPAILPEMPGESQEINALVLSVVKPAY
jgi:transcriptional regulator with XRE-family HTH domain